MRFSGIVHINVFLSCWLNYLCFDFSLNVELMDSFLILMTWVLNLFYVIFPPCSPFPGTVFLWKHFVFCVWRFILIIISKSQFLSEGEILFISAMSKYFLVLWSKRKVIPMMFNYKFFAYFCVSKLLNNKKFFVFLGRFLKWIFLENFIENWFPALKNLWFRFWIS